MTDTPDPLAAREAMMARFGKTLAASVKLKRVMLDRGLRRARAKCPNCGNLTLQGALVGRKDHLRMWCETAGCETGAME